MVFRVVLANPLTTLDILRDILSEQRAIGDEPAIAAELEVLQAAVDEVLGQDSTKPV